MAIRLKKLLKSIASWTGFCLVMLVSLVTIALAGARLYLSNACLRDLATDQLAHIINQDVVLESVDLKLRSGLAIKGLEIRDPDDPLRTPLLKLDKLVVDYDISKLYKRAVTVNNVEVASPHIFLEQKDGRWNFEAMLPPPAEHAPPKPVPKPEEPGPPRGPFRSPIDVVIKQILLSDLCIHIKQDDANEVRLDGLNVKIWGEISRTTNNLKVVVYTSNVDKPGDPASAAHTSAKNFQLRSKAEQLVQLLTALVIHVNIEQQDFQRVRLDTLVELANTDATVDKPLPRFDLACRVKANADLLAQRVVLNALDLTIAKKSALQLSGVVSGFLDHPHVDVRMEYCAFDLGELFGLAKPLAPDPGMSVSGRLEVPTLWAKGCVDGSKPMDAGLGVRLKNFHVNYPKMKAAARGVDVSFDVPKVRVAKFLPQAAKAILGVDVAQASYDNISLRGMTARLVVAAAGIAQGGDTTSVESASIKSRFGLASADMADKKLHVAASGLAATVTASADRADRDSLGVGAERGEVSVRAKLARMDAHVAGAPANAGQNSASADVAATVVGLSMRVGAKVDRLHQSSETIRVARAEVEQSFGLKAVTATASAATATAVARGLEQGIEAIVEDVTLKRAAATVTNANVAAQVGLGPIVAQAPDLQARVGSLTERLHVEGSRMAHNPQFLSLGRVTVENTLALAGIQAEVQARSAQVDKLTHEIWLEAAGRDLSECQAKMRLDIPKASARDPEFGQFQTPLRLTLQTDADLAAGNVSDLNLHLSLGPLMDVRVSARAQAFGRDNLWARTSLDLDLGEAVKLITPEIEAKFGQVQMAGSVGASALARGKLGTAEQPGEIGVDADVTTRIQSLNYPKMNAKVKSLAVDVDASTRYAMSGEVTSTTANVEVNMADAAAMNMAAVHLLKVNVEAAAPKLSDVAAKVALDVRQAAYTGTVASETADGPVSLTFATAPIDISLALDAHADTDAEVYTLRNMEFEVADFLLLDARARYAMKTSKFEAALNQRLGLAQALAHVPDVFRQGIPDIQTDMVERLSLWTKGRVPTEAEINALTAPVELTLKVAVDGDMELPQMGVAVRGLTQKLAASFRGRRLKVDERAKVRRLRYVEPVADKPEDGEKKVKRARLELTIQPELSLTLGLDDFNAFSFAAAASLPREGAEVKVNASADGLRRFVEQRGVKSPKDVLEHVNADFSLGVRADDLSRFDLPEGMKAKGSLRLDATAKLEANRAASAGLQVGVHGLEATIPGAAEVGRTDVGFSLSREFAIVDVAQAQAHKPRPEPLSDSFLGKVETLLATRSRETARTLYSDLRANAGRADSVRVESIRSGAYGVDSFSVDLNFEDGVWIDHISMSVLGGSVWGRIGAGLMGHSYVVGLAMEFTGLNGKSLLLFLDESVPDEDAEISGNFMLAVRLGSHQQLGLDDIHMAMNITKVGSMALDRFLLAQDPTESDPNIVAARKYTRLGRPYRVSVRVVNGEMRQAVSVQLVSGLVVSLPMPESVPLGKIMDLGMFEGPLRALSQVQGILQKLAATKIKIAPSGAVEFSR